MTESQKTCLIITGMHQSGTDLLAGCLQLLGVQTAGEVACFPTLQDQPPAQLQELSLIHDLLLQDLGSSWQQAGPLPAGWESTEPAQAALSQLQGLLQEHLLDAGLFAVSDPRISRLLPLWLQLASNLQLDLRFVLSVRRPWDVASYLVSQNGIDQHKAHLLWLVHNQEAFLSTHAYPRCLVIYEQLLSNPISVLQGLGQELPLDISSELLRGSRERVLSALRPSLLQGMRQRKHQVPEEFQDYQWLYEQIQSHGSGQTALLSGSAAAKQDSSAPASQELPLPFDPLEGKQAVESSQAGRFRGLLTHILNIMGQYEKAQQEQERQSLEALSQAASAGQAYVLRVFFPQEQAQDAELAQPLAAGQWRRITASVSNPGLLRRKGLSLQPLHRPGLLSISALSLVHAATGQTLWSADEQNGFQDLELQGCILGLNNPQARAAPLRLLVTGSDARLVLPALPDLPDAPLRFSAWVQAERDLSLLHEYWESEQLQQDQKAEQTLQELENHKPISQEVSSPVAQEEQNQEQENTIAELENSKQQQIQELQQKLQRQEELCKEYFTEMSKLEEQLGQEQAQAGQEKIAELESRLRQKEMALSREQARAKEEKQALVAKLEKLQKRYEAKVNILTKWSMKRKRKRIEQTIRDSVFFDPEYYLQQYPDVRESGMDPLRHYMNHGWKEGRNPSPKFNTNKYLQQNPDVALEHINPLEHYVLHGQHENRPDPRA